MFKPTNGGSFSTSRILESEAHSLPRGAASYLVPGPAGLPSSDSLPLPASSSLAPSPSPSPPSSASSSASSAVEAARDGFAFQGDDSEHDATEHRKRIGRRWAEDVERSRLWCLGELPCIDCGGAPRKRPSCRECDGRGFHFVPVRRPEAGLDHLLEGLSELADLVGDYQARGGEEHLPPRSRRLLAELNGGLGASVADFLGRLRDLEDDMVAVDDDDWPQGDEALDKLHEAWDASSRAEAETRASETRAFSPPEQRSIRVSARSTMRPKRASWARHCWMVAMGSAACMWDSGVPEWSRSSD